jgi:hypothetical protein
MCRGGCGARCRRPLAGWMRPWAFGETRRAGMAMALQCEVGDGPSQVGMERLSSRPEAFVFTPRGPEDAPAAYVGMATPLSACF